MKASNLEQFFSNIEGRLNQSREAQKDSIKGFFADLIPRLEAARDLDEEMNRVFAHRFNVLDYLRTDEVGLSRIVADLFDPNASHGQGTFFLKSFISELEKENNNNINEKWLEFDSSDVRVFVEKTIKGDRRIDIYVTIKYKSDTYCLAIENKPYAGDQERQVVDYLEHLDKYYNKNFLLIYLPSRGQLPSESSLPKSKYKAWKGRFKIMAYHNEPNLSGIDSDLAKLEEDDGLADYRIAFSLANWVSECRKNCEIDRLRSFLHDAERFCVKMFGDQLMTIDSESKEFEKFVFSDPAKYLGIAQIAYSTWPHIRDRISKDVLKFISAKCEQRLNESELDCKGIKFSIGYEGRAYGNFVFMYRDSWGRYGKSTSRMARTSVLLENQNSGPNGWGVGVASPKDKSKMEEEEVIRRTKLENAMQDLDGRTFPWWVKYEEIESSMRYWDNFVPDLQSEVVNGGGRITDYFVNKFCQVAVNAIPIIDKIEGSQ